MWSAQSVFVCALMLLGRTERSFPPVQFVEKAPIGVSPAAEAYVLTDEKRIVLITSAWAFRAARQAQYECGRVEALHQIAGVLAHEEWHVRYGLDEEGAYDAQLTALTSVGASPTLYNSVMRAKLHAVSESKRRARAGVVARGNP